MKLHSWLTNKRQSLRQNDIITREREKHIVGRVATVFELENPHTPRGAVYWRLVSGTVYPRSSHSFILRSVDPLYYSFGGMLTKFRNVVPGSDEVREMIKSKHLLRSE